MIAHLAFWTLMAYGWFWQELSPKGMGVLIALWLAGFFALPYLPYGAALFHPSWLSSTLRWCS